MHNYRYNKIIKINIEVDKTLYFDYTIEEELKREQPLNL